MIDFFISYNQTNRNWAEWIAWQLEEAGYTTVLQAWDLTIGPNFVQQLDHEGGQADHRRIFAGLPDLAVHPLRMAGRPGINTGRAEYLTRS